EAKERGELRRDIEVLPHEGLQQMGVVRHVIEDLRGGQPVSVEHQFGLGMVTHGGCFHRTLLVPFASVQLETLTVYYQFPISPFLSRCWQQGAASADTRPIRSPAAERGTRS